MDPFREMVVSDLGEVGGCARFVKSTVVYRA